MTESAKHFTHLLEEARGGDRDAADRLLVSVYDELRRIAKKYMRGERAWHTLQPTALVHEAYICLIDQAGADWKSRAHFLGVAATAMRHILVDHARARRAGKREGGFARVTLDEAIAKADDQGVDIVALNEALDRLQTYEPRLQRVVELRYFGGLTQDECAELLGVSVATIRRDERLACAWLRRELSR